MICESGRVSKLDGSWAWIETMQMSACTSCSAKKGCGQSALGSVFSGKRHLVKVSVPDAMSDIAVNDKVELAIDELVMLRSSVMVYLLPLLSMVIGALIFSHLYATDDDWAAILGALVGFSGACFALRRFSLARANDVAYQPILHKIITRASDIESLSVTDPS